MLEFWVDLYVVMGACWSVDTLLKFHTDDLVDLAMGDLDQLLPLCFRSCIYTAAWPLLIFFNP